MASLFGPFQTPRIQRRQVDPAQLAQILAGPEVAKQQARASLFQEIGQLPQNLFSTLQQFKELEQKGKTAGLEREKTQSEIDFLKARSASLGQSGMMIPVIDPITGEEKFRIPKGSKLAPESTVQKVEIKETGFKKESLELLKQAKDILSKVPPGALKGGFQRLGAASGQFGSIEASQYQAIKPSVATKIYRGFTGDVRLSDADAAARAMPLLPNITDTKPIRDAKFKILDAVLGGETNPDIELDALIKISSTVLANKARAAKSKGIDAKTIIEALKKDIGK